MSGYFCIMPCEYNYHITLELSGYLCIIPCCCVFVTSSRCFKLKYVSEWSFLKLHWYVNQFTNPSLWRIVGEGLCCHVSAKFTVERDPDLDGLISARLTERFNLWLPLHPQTEKRKDLMGVPSKGRDLTAVCSSSLPGTAVTSLYSWETI